MGGAATGLLLGDKTEIRTWPATLAESGMAPELRVTRTDPFLRHCHHTTFPSPEWLLKGPNLHSCIFSSSGIFTINDYCNLDLTLSKWLRALLGINGLRDPSTPLREASASERAWHLSARPWAPATGGLYLHFHHVDGIPAAFDLL